MNLVGVIVTSAIFMSIYRIFYLLYVLICRKKYRCRYTMAGLWYRAGLEQALSIVFIVGVLVFYKRLLENQFGLVTEEFVEMVKTLIESVESGAIAVRYLLYFVVVLFVGHMLIGCFAAVVSDVYPLASPARFRNILPSESTVIEDSDALAKLKVLQVEIDKMLAEQKSSESTES